MTRKIRRKIPVYELMDERKEYNCLFHSSDISAVLRAIPIPDYQGRGPCETEIFRRIYRYPVTERQVYTDLFVNIKDYKYFSIIGVREVFGAEGVIDFGCTIKYYGWRKRSKCEFTHDDWLSSR